MTEIFGSHIQGDETFERFKRELHAAVSSCARRVSCIESEAGRACCPLGAHPEGGGAWPSSSKAHAAFWGFVKQEDLADFINGFGNGARDSQVWGLGKSDPRTPYSELGKAYGRAFP